MRVAVSAQLEEEQQAAVGLHRIEREVLPVAAGRQAPRGRYRTGIMPSRGRRLPHALGLGDRGAARLAPLTACIGAVSGTGVTNHYRY